MNRSLKLLIFSDFILLGSTGLIGPILALFIAEELVGGSALAAGMATMFYLLTRSIGGWIWAYVVDIIDHHKEFLIAGSILLASGPFLYLAITNVYQLFLVQILMGIGAAISIPIWYVYFTHNIEPEKEGYTWSMYGSWLGIGMAITAGAGGFIAQTVGFTELFVIVGVLGMVGLIPLFFIKEEKLEIKKHAKNYAKHHAKKIARIKR